MNRAARWLALSLVVAAAGCATAPAPRRERAEPPRARCLSDPGREAHESTRPLFFLFCIESP